MEKVFVQFGEDMRVEGDAAPVKMLIEDHIKSRIEAGSGAIITDASDELHDHILDLVAKFPWTGTISLPKRGTNNGQVSEKRESSFLRSSAAE